MILDALSQFFTNAAYDAASKEVDLSNPDNGKGEPVKVQFNCGGQDLAGATGLVIETGTAPGGPYTAKSTYTFTAAQLNNGVSFVLTPDQGLGRYAVMSFTGTVTAGTDITAGLCKDTDTAEN